MADGKLVRPGDPAFKTASHGVFTTSSAVDAVTKENCRKLMFTTNSHLHFFPKSLTAPERGENCLTVYEKNRKNHQFCPREAPLHHRTSANYSKEFSSKKALDFQMNKELAEMSRQPVPTEKLPDQMPGSTMYAEQFRQLTADEVRGAKLPRQDPYLTLFRPGQPMIIKRPASQEQFQEWPLRQLDKTRPMSALHTKAQDHDQGQLGEFSKTMYNFTTGPKQKRNSPMAVARCLPRSASVSAIGGTTVRLKYMSAHQNDYLVATRSFSRGAMKSEGSLL
jgi:hypothetical protein